MKRVSYNTLPDGTIVSNLMPLQTMLVYALINADSLTYEIRFLRDDEVGLLREGVGGSVQNIKDTIRAELKNLGVTFKDEIRKKMFLLK